MRLKDAEGWQKSREANQDPYGKAGLDYAERWAEMMEQWIPEDSTEKFITQQIENVAERCSHVADTEGITGFMYGCAVGLLSQVWEHGDALRRWHNLDCQIGTEGEEANESGKILNPAILDIK